MATKNTANQAANACTPINGADAVVSFLRQQAVEVVFGMVGGSAVSLFDALYRAGAPKILTVGHEQGAAHMAEGFARVTGWPGVVATTSGPGATNLVTGLADAMMDSTPMVAITCQVTSDLLGNDAFQEADMWGITMPITKHNYQVQSVDELAQAVSEAFFLAASGRPGPVLIDLPKDVSLAACGEMNSLPMRPQGYRTHYKADPRQVAKALEQIRQAKQPVILAGGGIIHAEASAELTKLAERLNIPVTTTLMGMGAFPARHALSLGMPGMHGTGYANLALHNADLILCVGSRLDDRITGKTDQFAPKAQLIQIDVDPSEIGKILPCLTPIEGDAKSALKSLNDGVMAWESLPDYSPWLKQIDEWKRRHPMTYRVTDGVISPQMAIEKWAEHLDEDAVIVTGVGQHQMHTAQYYPFVKPRTFITSGGLGTMGFGLPAAIGAKVARPDKTVVCLDGDGSFLMTIQELATAVRYRIPVVVTILNNSSLGMVRQWQHLFFDNRLSGTPLEPPPYDKVAMAFGGLGRSVTRPEELDDAYRWALAASRQKSLPVVLDVVVDPEEIVLPMVPAGEANINFLPCRKKE